MKKAMLLVVAILVVSISSNREISQASIVKQSPRSVLFIGDSFCSGVGATSPSNSFPQVLSRTLKVSEIVQCQGGTGYLARGSGYASCGRSVCLDYLGQLQQVGKLERQKISLVLISGGKNDVGWPGVFVGDNYVKKIESVIKYVKTNFPAARLVICQPFWDNSPIPSGENWAEAQLSQTAAFSKVPYLTGLITLLQDSNSSLVVNGHPNDAGHALIAKAITDGLKSIGLAG
jgi:lysophospholipase L1-like esterase